MCRTPLERSRRDGSKKGATGSYPGTTGRIGSRQHLAESVGLVSLGCYGGPQRYCGDHLHLIQCWLQGEPILRKIGRFSIYACGDAVNLPHVAKHAFGDQMGPNMQKAMPFGSPPHQGLKNCGLSQKMFLFFDLFFRAHRGDFCGFCAAGHILWLAYFMTVLAAPGRLNRTWAAGKTHTSEWSVLYGTYGHVHRYRGHIQ